MSTIVMPRLSDTMDEGTILRWLKAEGEELARGEELVEIETDKATMTYESDVAGTLHLLAAEGDTLPVGQPIAEVGGSGPGTAGDEAAATSAPQRTSPQPMSAPQPAPASVTSAETPPPLAAAVDAGSTPAPGSTIPADATRVKASPLAKRIAREDEVDLTGIAGTGPGGRIVKADVLAAERSGTSRGAGVAPAPTAAGEQAPVADAGAAGGASVGGGLAGVATAKGETSSISLSKTQQTVARRMAESKATIPDFSLQIEVDMEDCVALRTQLKTVAAGGAEQVPTYNDMVVKACALALREHPLANGSYRDGAFQLHSRVNVGVAVAAEGSLVVPTVFDADVKALGEIARETRTLAARVRDGSITPPELGGGTFTVSNLGMYGIERFTAIINPPQAAIMSVGALTQRAVVHEGALVARHTLFLTLACDHRILYGAPAAEFLARVRELLQAPASLSL